MNEPLTIFSDRYICETTVPNATMRQEILDKPQPDPKSEHINNQVYQIEIKTEPDGSNGTIINNLVIKLGQTGPRQDKTGAF